MYPADIDAIVRIIQLAIAPVFLLVGTASLLNVMVARLARIVDRVRSLERHLSEGCSDEERRRELGELAILSRRMTICQNAIAACTLSAVLVCVTVIVLFLASIMTLNFTVPVALLFIAVMIALTVGLLLFFVEVSISARAVRVREDYIREGRAPHAR
ncbi:DUF2721 domain-containing protein [Allosphingosinicella indica]|uniref:DUF2721 domain-containing protein n=1 Tax=Allosphingosinicella indica TaxID=941907 RepID=A0A1X7G0T1_9SPHN|nr:DUF2721 domain-containing protein [Allosphingosinicella indica]SMF61483.1 Protein of unknown function [Allosphingosinicella indica]